MTGFSWNFISSGEYALSALFKCSHVSKLAAFWSCVVFAHGATCLYLCSGFCCSWRVI